jgi:hypothetical protein
MKLRAGFVSNSSSASFIVKKDGLTQSQKYIVDNYKETALKSTDAYADEIEDWLMTETMNYYEFSTSMDNFSLNGFLNPWESRSRILITTDKIHGNRILPHQQRG